MKTLILALTLVIVQFVVNPAQAFENGEIVDTETAKELFDRGVLFVDVRDAVDYKNGHIPGAIHIDVRKSSGGFKTELVKVAKKDQEVVFYCRGWGCTRSLTAIILAKSLDFEKLYRYKLGYPDWRSKGHPIEK